MLCQLVFELAVYVPVSPLSPLPIDIVFAKFGAARAGAAVLVQVGLVPLGLLVLSVGGGIYAVRKLYASQSDELALLPERSGAFYPPIGSELAGAYVWMQL